MWRRLLTISVAASSLLCVATCALWARSYWVVDSIEVSDRGPMDDSQGAWRLYTYTQSIDGRISFFYQHLTIADPDAARFLLADPCAQPVHTRRADRAATGLYQRWPHERAGFSASNQGDLTIVSFPHGALAGVVAILPLIFVAHMARRRRQLRQSGCCSVCGYDLRASLERCPECGSPDRSGPT